jgi:hypothetical protein
LQKPLSPTGKTDLEIAASLNISNQKVGLVAFSASAAPVTLDKTQRNTLQQWLDLE